MYSNDAVILSRCSLCAYVAPLHIRLPSDLTMGSARCRTANLLDLFGSINIMLLSV